MRLKELRVERNLTQKELGNLIGVAQSNINRWENETVQPSAEFVIKLANLFMVSTDYLLGRTDELGAVVGQVPLTDNYSDEERQLIEDYRNLTPPLRQMLQDTIRTWKSAEREIQRRSNNQ